MRLSATAALKTKEESKKLQNFSKQWLPGDTLRVLYPLFWDEETKEPELLVGAVWGFQVNDIKAFGLKTAFIPSLNEFSEDGQPIGTPDVTYRFSLIAPCFPEGQKADEEARIQAKNWPSEASRKEALKTLEVKYDTKNNMKAVKPVITRAKYLITTEALVIPVVGGVPVKGKEAVVSAPLSNLNIRRIDQIIKNPAYRPEYGTPFIEIEWAFPAATEKSDSSKAVTPTGLSETMRLEYTRPDDWAWIKNMIPLLADSSETISRRATRSIDEGKIRQAITQYVYLNSEFLDTLPEEAEETLLRNVSLLDDLSLTKAVSSEALQTKIAEALANVETTPVESATGNSFTAEVPAATFEAAIPAAPVTFATPEEVLAAPSLTTLLQGGDNASDDSEFIDSVDLTTLMN